MAQVAVQSIRSLQITEIDILPAVAVHVTDGHAGSVMRHSVGRIEVSLHRIGEPNACRGWIHQSESGFPTGPRMHLKASKARALRPRRCRHSLTVKAQ